MRRAIHLYQRIIKMCREYPTKWHDYGMKVANVSFIDGIIPPGKSPAYIQTISEYVNSFAADLAGGYARKKNDDQFENRLCSTKAEYPIWCCWWQGEDSMPELVRLCYTRLKQIIPEEVQLRLITLDNYQQYVTFPEHILNKFNQGIITMTTMSDVLRFLLLEKYGGYWLDATVFFSGNIPDEYFTENFFCQKMSENTKYAKREACRSMWCGFSMAGKANLVIFRYMNEAFFKWFQEYDSIIDYVLIDYLLWSGYTQVPEIAAIINQVPDNNEDIFELYKVLNLPYSEELYRTITERNVMHKLTYKMDLHRYTPDGKLTMYGYLYDLVFESKEEKR